MYKNQSGKFFEGLKDAPPFLKDFLNFEVQFALYEQ